ncbi:MAG: hypothetical protein LBL65_06635 [Campylobacteraceae bacterium]|jgi:hypothetical protein|nr:hypothetical protein [Campylobacteraceae bacterium]
MSFWLHTDFIKREFDVNASERLIRMRFAGVSAEQTEAILAVAAKINAAGEIRKTGGAAMSFDVRLIGTKDGEGRILA